MKFVLTNVFLLAIRIVKFVLTNVFLLAIRIVKFVLTNVFLVGYTYCEVCPLQTCFCWLYVL